MRLAAECGISSARVEYLEFEDAGEIEPAIVIERYDRAFNGEAVLRMHQEDFCQALGCLPENKYSMYGHVWRIGLRRLYRSPEIDWS